MANILILGAGGFGTALAVLCDKCGHRVTLYSPFQQEIETLSAAREHKKLLPGVIIPESVAMTWAASRAFGRRPGHCRDPFLRRTRRLRLGKGDPLPRGGRLLRGQGL